MNYPPAVRALVERLKKYTPDAALRTCDVVHIYPGPLAYPDGHADSRFFELHLYNSKSLQKRVYATCESLDFAEGVGVDMIRVFADGSTLVKFTSPVTVVLEGYFGTTAIVCEADEQPTHPNRWGRLAYDRPHNTIHKRMLSSWRQQTPNSIQIRGVA